jgi:hypothetical protein
MLLIAIVPNPNCGGRKEIYAYSTKELVANIRAFIVDSDYGASDVGANFSVYREGNLVGTATYNGKFFWADPLYNPANPGHTVTYANA